ncbi:hypothetical protein ACFOD0_11370 [Shewanella intestini]|uniref:Uncharacterized protein n=1 Tax=Shewanella intestini TaxID=2017544 RepID=A0ABS5I2X7_9GAMM|nr:MULTISPECIES: hypothetical protein [Shewanella]MBR9728383.1 hypothetical protein [Shewanella intestini]
MNRSVFYMFTLFAILMVGQAVSNESHSKKDPSTQKTHLKHNDIVNTTIQGTLQKVSLSSIFMANYLYCLPMSSGLFHNISSLSLSEPEANNLSTNIAIYLLLIIFCNYFIIKKARFRTPLQINLISIVLSWIKPVKGCPS